MFKEEFKQKREELDDLLIELAVPKLHWHNLTFLNLAVSQLEPTEIRNKAIKLIHEISPMQLTWLVPEGEINAEESLPNL